MAIFAMIRAFKEVGVVFLLSTFIASHSRISGRSVLVLLVCRVTAVAAKGPGVGISATAFDYSKTNMSNNKSVINEELCLPAKSESLVKSRRMASVRIGPLPKKRAYKSSQWTSRTMVVGGRRKATHLCSWSTRVCLFFY
jgi:hypothetical protein